MFVNNLIYSVIIIINIIRKKEILLKSIFNDFHYLFISIFSPFFGVL